MPRHPQGRNAVKEPGRRPGLRTGRAVPQPCADCHAVRGRPKHSAAARQRGVTIGEQTRPCRSRRRRGVRGPVADRAWPRHVRSSATRCLPAARAARPRRQEARQERCAANRKNARPLAAPAAASARSFAAALIWRSALSSCPPPLFARKRHRYRREQINLADQLVGLVLAGAGSTLSSARFVSRS